MAEPEKEDYYSTLGLDSSASREDIHTAYKKLALKWHPDKNQGNEEAQKMFVNISTAYKVLEDEEQRKLYDKHGAEGLKEHNMSTEEAARQFEAVSKLFDAVFVMGKDQDAAATRSHGYKQASVGAVKAPLVGATLGVLAVGAGLFSAGLHVGKGLAGGVSNFVGGVKDVRCAIKAGQKAKAQKRNESMVGVEDERNPGASVDAPSVDAPSEEKESQEKVPTIGQGLKRATVGLVAAPLLGIAKGLGSVATGAVGGAVMFGAGLKGAHANVTQGRKEVRKALEQERERGVPDLVKSGEALVAGNYMQKLEALSLFRVFEDEELRFFHCFSRSRVQERERVGEDEEADLEEEGQRFRVVQRVDETSNCVFLTTHRLFKLDLGACTSEIPLDRIVKSTHVRRTMGADRVVVETKEGVFHRVAIRSKRVAAFFNAQLLQISQGNPFSSMYNEEEEGKAIAIAVPSSINAGAAAQQVTQELHNLGRGALLRQTIILDGEGQLSGGEPAAGDAAERLLFHHCNVSGPMGGITGPSKGDRTFNCVLLTTQRLVQVAKGRIVAEAELARVMGATHIKRSAFSNDQVLVQVSGELKEASQVPGGVPMPGGPEVSVVKFVVSNSAAAYFFKQHLHFLASRVRRRLQEEQMDFVEDQQRQQQLSKQNYQQVDSDSDGGHDAPASTVVDDYAMD